MKKQLRIVGLALVTGAVLTLGVAIAKQRLAFSGGPEGGTFQYFSNGMASRLSKDLPGVEVSNTASAGSLENLRRVDSGEADFGIVYSGDVFLARNGELTQDTKRYENVLAVAYLYGAPAHMVVLADSGIDSVADLAGKRVAVGGAGSGAATAAERYFTSIGLWHEMRIEYLGYSEAASAMGDKLIDGFWVFAGYPMAAVIQAAASNSVKLLPLAAAGEAAGFFAEYPFYTRLTIPKATYSGVDYDVASFQDAALWVAGRHLEGSIVHDAVADIYSREGLAYMVKVKSTAKAMSVESALDGIVTPLHPGAARFWTEKGLALTDAQRAP